MGEKVVMAHGSGGEMTTKLINDIFAEAFDNEYLAQMEDATLVPGNAVLAVTTDSFVVEPVEFKGGNIGSLCIAGTVNDLAMRGAIPKYLTAGFILEEGLDVEVLKRVVNSMAEYAKEAKVKIVAGDTKVVPGSGGMYINTTGVGFARTEEIGAKHIKNGDVIIVSGNLGDHHAALLSERMKIENNIKSDAAVLSNLTAKLFDAGIEIHAMRDVTRGGLGTVLSEMSEESGKQLVVQENALPVSAEVGSFAKLLGLDPLYMGNEGKMVLFVNEGCAEEALSILKADKLGENAAIIGRAYEADEAKAILKTKIGGEKRLNRLRGEGLPRIC